MSLTNIMDITTGFIFISNTAIYAQIFTIDAVLLLSSYFRHCTFQKYLSFMQYHRFLTLLWKCGSANGDVSVFTTHQHHQLISLQMPPVQKWWRSEIRCDHVNKSVESSDLWSARGGKPRINQELWTTELSGEQMFCLVFRVCEVEPHAEEEEADFRGGRGAALWCPKAEPWPLWNVLKVLRHIRRFVSNPFKFEVSNLKIYIHVQIILI